MENEVREKLEQAGVNVEDAMERFLENEGLLMTFLKKFSNDPNYERLVAAMGEKRYDDAFTAAHTIKGMCGNLSISGLFGTVCKEVEALRSGDYPLAEELLPEVQKEYTRVVELLDSL